ncbi:MAG TPA: TetR/AcrR family transcriptional regulator [Polyangiaceae bacterium]|nr:TetR/AcrR family transcriptional regulator [Polyangiaceae bacterium]
MARPREFDIEKALEDVIEVFWSRGYSGASIEDLVEGTGLAKGSIYKAFGDKHTLFLRALDRYIDARLALFEETLAQPGSPKAAIRQSLLDHMARATGSTRVRGCLVTKTTTEMASHDPEIARHLSRMFERLETLFAQAIVRAKDAGEVDVSKDERAIARLLVLTTQGVRVMSHMRPHRHELGAAIDVALSALG